MQTYDFSRSFLTFRLDLQEKPPVTLSHTPPTSLNNARIQLECCCTLTHRPTGAATRYVLGAACKAERVGAERDIWMQPNADFCLAASEEEFLILKSWHRNDPGVMLEPPSLGPQPERQSGAVADVWTRFRIALHAVEGRPLATIDAILAATFANRPLIARTEYDEGDFHVCLDYPVKTFNVSEREWVYQTDTGPHLLPDLSPERLGRISRPIECFDLAYSAFNAPEWAEFILRIPTKVSEEISVNHYSKTRRIENTRNVIIDIDAPAP